MPWLFLCPPQPLVQGPQSPLKSAKALLTLWLKTLEPLRQGGVPVSSPATCSMASQLPRGASPSVRGTQGSDPLDWSPQTGQPETGLRLKTVLRCEGLSIPGNTWSAATHGLHHLMPLGHFSRWRRVAVSSNLTFLPNPLACTYGFLCLPLSLLELSGEHSLTPVTEKIYLTLHWFFHTIL